MSMLGNVFSVLGQGNGNGKRNVERRRLLGFCDEKGLSVENT